MSGEAWAKMRFRNVLPTHVTIACDVARDEDTPRVRCAVLCLWAGGKGFEGADGIVAIENRAIVGLPPNAREPLIEARCRAMAYSRDSFQSALFVSHVGFPDSGQRDHFRFPVSFASLMSRSAVASFFDGNGPRAAAEPIT